MPRVDFLDRLVVEPEPLDRAGRHVLGRDVGLFQHLLDDLEPLRGLQIDRDRLLVDVELAEIPGIVIGLAGPQAPSGIAAPRVLDFHHLGAEPRQHLGAGRPRLELREIDDFDALQKLEVLCLFAHGCSLHLIDLATACAISPAPAMLSQPAPPPVGADGCLRAESRITLPRLRSGSRTRISAAVSAQIYFLSAFRCRPRCFAHAFCITGRTHQGRRSPNAPFPRMSTLLTFCVVVPDGPLRR